MPFLTFLGIKGDYDSIYTLLLLIIIVEKHHQKIQIIKPHKRNYSSILQYKIEGLNKCIIEASPIFFNGSWFTIK